MPSHSVRYLKSAGESHRALHGVQLGRIVEVTPDGRPVVQLDGAARPTIARIAVPLDPHTAEVRADMVVTVICERADPALPIIVGFVRDTVTAIPNSVQLNGRTLTFEGRDEIVLRCGLASITIRANGHVIVKGTRLMSKASETNKIRGASVLIN